MTTQQPDALIPDEKTVMAQAQVYASTWAIVGSRFDAGDGLELAEQEKTILADMVRRLGARITELEAQLAQRFDAADMATASAQGFMDGVASVSAWSEHVEQRLLAWRQSFVNRSGDQLALDDFMDKQSIDDLIDFVCDEWALSTHPSPPEGMGAAKEQQAGWVSVDERLPGEQGQDSEEVMVFINGHCALTDFECRQGGAWGIRLGYFDAERQLFRVHGRPDSSVTHWMKLPEAPNA